MFQQWKDFIAFFKEDRHPHTNMAKAALNMLTHTSSGTLAKDGIFMNAVDRMGYR
jgi:NAD(P)-dependent dehydrogenase (short-subunit alcohol dehydrogenase family)